MADITVTTDVSQINNLKEALKSADTAYVRVVDSIVRENNRLKSLLKKAAKDTEETNKIKEQADAIYTAKLQQESAKREKVRAREAAAAEKEAQRIAAANQKIIDSEVKRRAKEEQAASSYAQGFQGQVGRNLGLGAAGVSASASASAMEAEIERLRQKYDSVYASSQLYERSLQEMNKAHMLGVTSAKQHEAAVESLNAEYQAFQNGTATVYNRFAQGIQQTGQGLNNAGVLIQQLGYQTGDFIVQVQSGTSAFVAFGQQATQLVGFLPMLAAEAGVAKVAFMGFNIAIAPLTLGLSIIIPLLTAVGAAFTRVSSDNKKTADVVETLDQKLKSLDATLQEFVLTKKAAAAGVSVDELISVEGLEQAQENLTSALETLKNFNKNIASYGAAGIGGGAFAIARQEGEQENLVAAQEAYAKAVERVNSVRNKGYIEAAEFAAEERKNLQDQLRIQDLSAQYGEDSMFVFLEELRIKKESYAEDLKKKGLGDSLIKLYVAQFEALEQGRKRAELETIEVEKRVALANQYHASMIAVQNAHKIAAEQSKLIAERAYAEQLAYMGKSKQESERFKDNLVGASEAARQVAQIMFSNISFGADEALRMARNLTQASLNYGKLVNRGESGPDAARRSVLELNAPGLLTGTVASGAGGVFVPENVGGSGGGGGGGGGNARLDTLIEQLRTEREVLEEWYTQSQETLMSASENELQIIGGYNEAKLRLAKEYQDRLAKINEEGKTSQLETVLSGSAEILGAMGAFSDKALRISKAFAAAEALVSTYRGAAKELEKGVIGFGTAAAVIARGIAFVAAIKNISSSGSGGSIGSGGGGRGSATVAPTSAASTPQTVFIDSIDPKSLYSGETLINLFEAFYDENDRRGKVFVVAR